jgi:hypothetical protein
MLAFLRSHDAGFRLRRMRHLIRRLEEAREELSDVPAHHHDTARDAAWQGLSLALSTGPVAPSIPERAVLSGRSAARYGRAGDIAAFGRAHRRHSGRGDPPCSGLAGAVMLLAYLGFAFYDVATLTLTRGMGEAEMNPVKIDRISPATCPAAR